MSVRMRVLALFVSAWSWPAVLAAQGGPPPARVGPVFMPTVHYGAPLRAAGGIVVFQRLGDTRSGVIGNGLVVEASAGQSGARASAGYLGFEDAMALDARLVLSRTWGSPLHASTDSTYAGIEAGLWIAYVRVGAGIARRLAGPSGAHRTVFTWSAGLQFPIR